MSTPVILGIFVLIALVVLCFAAYKIKARRFMFSAAVWKLFSFTLTITSDPPKSAEQTTPEP